ncbi:hypothetical protein BU15DRAFT_59523 [Melanogaster broomeanus]|nr:hypothetical protein BU15DRAFT_59523 [Melanogaster broomeanus]
MAADTEVTRNDGTGQPCELSVDAWMSLGKAARHVQPPMANARVLLGDGGDHGRGSPGKVSWDVEVLAKECDQQYLIPSYPGYTVEGTIGQSLARSAGRSSCNALVQYSRAWMFANLSVRFTASQVTRHGAGWPQMRWYFCRSGVSVPWNQWFYVHGLAPESPLLPSSSLSATSVAEPSGETNYNHLRVPLPAEGGGLSQTEEPAASKNELIIHTWKRTELPTEAMHQTTRRTPDPCLLL